MDDEVKVSELPEANGVNDEDILMLVQNGTNKKASVDTLLANVKNAIDEVDTSKIDKTLANFEGDLNTIKTTGFIYASGTASNIPLSGYSFFVMTMALNVNYVNQIAYRLAGGSNNMETYQRECNGGYWTDWDLVCQPIKQGTTTVDFNTLKGSGTYYFNVVPTGSNKPASSGLQAGVLEVVKHPLSNMGTQRYTYYDGTKIHQRGWYGSTWYPWKTITLT